MVGNSFTTTKAKDTRNHEVEFLVSLRVLRDYVKAKLRFNLHDKSQGAASRLCVDFPASLSGKDQTGGLKASGIAARDIRLHGRRAGVEAFAGYNHGCPFRSKPAHLIAFIAGDQVIILRFFPPGRSPQRAILIHKVIAESSLALYGRIVGWFDPLGLRHGAGLQSIRSFGGGT
jgi:hypothetical protein